MTPSGRRLALGAAAVLVAGIPVLAGPAPARAAACSGTSGVTVVVDFGALGGVAVGCAAGDPSSGLSALTAAGFGYTPVPGQPGLVCSVNGVPGPCSGPPPTSAYWSYWHARPGGSWSYSNTGAGSYNPAPGSVEGWSFGAGVAPGIAPPQPAPVSPPAQPAPTQPAPAQPPPAQPPPEQPPPAQPLPAQPAPTQPPARSPAAPANPTATPAPARQPAPGATGTVPATSSGPAAAGSPAGGGSAAPARADPRPAADVDEPGDALGLLAAVALIAALAGLAIWRARSRRSVQP
ncbi:MAG TPA: hypothetical protein VFM37_10605 [Pseudonocardiaceae bacterium]|nr:hypothetical protein [Pseudonocardiaceae bacterium]